MQILIIGKNHSAKLLAEILSKDKNDLIFTFENCSFLQKNEVDDFVEANDVSLVVSADFGSMTPFVPRFLTSYTSGKKLAYKSKIPTTKFAVFEKSGTAIDYLNEINLPVVIRPDFRSAKEAPYIAETRDEAIKRIEFLFETGNQKISIDGYIQGIELNKYIALDGYDLFDLAYTVSYFEEISTNNIKYVPNEALLKIENVIMPKFLEVFSAEAVEFRGIFGLSFLIDKFGEVYFTKFEPFIGEIDADIVLGGLEYDLKNILYSCSLGRMGMDIKEIKPDAKFRISADIGINGSGHGVTPCRNMFFERGEIVSSSANTMFRAIELIELKGAKIEEAVQYWKN